MVSLCCGGTKGIGAGGGFATLKLNQGGAVKVPFREVEKDEAQDQYGGEAKRRVIWNLDAVDVVTMFEQPDMVVPPDDSQDIMLQDLYTKLLVKAELNSGKNLEKAWSDVRERQHKRLKKAEERAALAITDGTAETNDQAAAPARQSQTAKKEVRPKSVDLPKVVRVFRYWTGYENSPDYWQQREARVIEIRHGTSYGLDGSSGKQNDAWWFIVADGVPLRCMEHPTSGSAVADKAIFNISFGVAEYVSEMNNLFDLEHPPRNRSDSQDQKATKASALTGRTLTGSCKMRWSATKMKWSYAVEVNGVPVPAMWSKPAPGISPWDITNKEETGNCPKSAYVPDVLCESKNLYTKEEIAQSNGEFLHVTAQAAKQAKNKSRVENPETGNPVVGDEGAAAGTVEKSSRKSASFLADSVADGAPHKFEYKTVRVWRFTIDHELRGVEVAHENKIWYILVDGIEKAKFDEKQLLLVDGKQTPSQPTDTKAKDAQTKSTMWGMDFKVKRCKRPDGRSEPVPDDENNDVDASMKMSWNRGKWRWEYLLIVNGTFVPQCGWKGSAVNPKDFCAVEVPEVSTRGDCLAIADAADSAPGAWRSLPWGKEDKQQKESQATNLHSKKAPTKTACIFNFTTKFRLRTVAVIHTGFKFTVSLDGKHIQDATHGSIPLIAMQCSMKFRIPLHDDGTPDEADIQEDMVHLDMRWNPRKEFKWQYLLSIAKKVEGKEDKWFRIEPTFDYGMAGGGKAVEVIDDTGRDLKLAESRKAGAAILDEEVEEILPLETRMAEAIGPKAERVSVTDKHGLSDGSLVSLESDVQEIVKISVCDHDGMIISFEGTMGEDKLRNPLEDESEIKKGGEDERDFTHPPGTKIVAFETSFENFLAEISSRLRFHPGTVEMHQDSRNAIKTLASLLRYKESEYKYEEGGTANLWALKIRGFTGQIADVFTDDRDLQFLGLKRADEVKSTLRAYLGFLQNGEPPELFQDPQEAERQDEAEFLEIGTEGVPPITAGDMDSLAKDAATAFTCTIEKCEHSKNNKGNTEMKSMRRERKNLTKKQELATAPKRFEITAKTGEVGANEGGEQLTMDITTPMQAFVFGQDTVAPGRKVGKTKTTKLRARTGTDASSRPRGETNFSMASLGNEPGSGGEDGAGNESNEEPQPILPRTESMDSNEALPVREGSMLATDHVRNSNMHRPAYKCDGTTVEFFSKTHKKWLAAVITKIRIEDTDQEGTSCTCFYDIEFSRNKQRRQFVAMDSLRLPIENNANVEVWSKKNGWIVGHAVGDPNSATTVGYTVLTDKGQFTKVPAERFRRRFPYAAVERFADPAAKVTAEGPEVLYYTNAIEGWVAAGLHPEVADGRSPSPGESGKCLIKELTLESDAHLQKIKTAGDQQDQPTGLAESSKKPAEAERAQAAQEKAGLGGAVLETPIPSAMGSSVGPSPATSLMPPLVEVGDPMKDIQPWTSIPLLMPKEEDQKNATLRKALLENGEGDIINEGDQEYRYVELWRIKAKPENWSPKMEETVKVAEPSAQDS